MTTRERKVKMALWLQDDKAFMEVTGHPEMDETGQKNIMLLREWGTYGLQTVEMPETYMAALMATDPYAAIEGQRMPWPTFAIAIPPGLVASSHGEVFLLIVATPPNYITYPPGVTPPGLMLCYEDAISAGVCHLRGVSELGQGTAARVEPPPGFEGVHLQGDLGELFDEKLEERLWNMLQRLAANVIIAINTARIDKPEAFATKKPNLKKGKAKAAIHRLGKPMTIDLRQRISDFISGALRKSPSVTTLVRGHYRNQPYGPRNSLRRARWIEPFLRGEGPMVQRPVRLQPPPQSE